jgi:hypothetical protein
MPQDSCIDSESNPVRLETIREDWCGRGESNPQGLLARRIFIPATVFTAAHHILKIPGRLWSGLSLHLSECALGAARLVSTPSRCRAWLGIAIGKVSPNLSSSASAVSHRALMFALSPLRLPVPPRPLTASIL